MEDTVNVVDVQDEFFRYKMPKLMNKIEGSGNGIKTVITNLPEIAKAIYRPPEYITKFFGTELGSIVKMDKKGGRYIVNGAHEASKLQSLLTKFIEKFVLCQHCNNPETKLVISKHSIDRECFSCGKQSRIDMGHRLVPFIERNPPTDAQYAPETSKAKSEREAQERKVELVIKKEEKEEEEIVASDDPVKLAMNEMAQNISSMSVQDVKDFASKNSIPEYKLIPVIVPNIFTENVMSEIAKKKEFIMNFCKGSRCQKGLIGGIERLVEKYPALLEKVAFILKAFYEADVLEEDACISWGKKVSRQFVSKELCRAIHVKAKPFVRWLQLAEEEDEEEEDDDE